MRIAQTRVIVVTCVALAAQSLAQAQGQNNGWCGKDDTVQIPVEKYDCRLTDPDSTGASQCYGTCYVWTPYTVGWCKECAWGRADCHCVLSAPETITIYKYAGTCTGRVYGGADRCSCAGINYSVPVGSAQVTRTNVNWSVSTRCKFFQ